MIPGKPQPKTYEFGQGRRPMGEVIPNVLRLWRQTADERGSVLPMIIISVLASALALTPPWILGNVFDRIIIKGLDDRFNLFFLLVAILLVAHIAMNIGQYFREVLAVHLGTAASAGLQKQLYAHLQKLGPDFYQRYSIGEIHGWTAVETRLVERLFQSSFISLLFAPIAFFGIVGLLIYVNWVLAPCALIPIPFILAVSLMTGKATRKIGPPGLAARDRYGARLQQNLGGMSLIQLFGRQGLEQVRLDEEVEIAISSTIKIRKLVQQGFAAIAVAAAIGSAAVITVSAFSPLGMQVTPGQLVMFLGYMAWLYIPLNEIAAANFVLQNLALRADRIFLILDEPARDIEVGDELSVPIGELSLRGATYLYPDSENGVREISVHVTRGEWVALTGASGCGKSTVAKLVVRQLDAQSGSLEINGELASRFNLQSCWKRIALVPQEDLLLESSVRENVRYGSPEANDTAVQEALRLAGLSNWVLTRANGLDTILGAERGALSAGEKQRLCLARALLVKPDILVLDETTSALDVTTEQEVLGGLRTEIPEMGVLLISHRPTTIAFADQVVTVED